MKTVATEKEFKDMFDENGIPTEPFTCIEGLLVDHLEFVTSFAGFTGSKYMYLHDLTNLKTLDGFKGAKGIKLSGLTNIINLDGFVSAEDMSLSGLANLKSLDGFKGAEYMELFGLVKLKTLDGFIGIEGMELSGLTSLENLDGFIGSEDTKLYGLDNCEVKAINPTKQEIEILKQIPLDRVRMSEWHCGTSHCLAGWSQVIMDNEEEDDDALEAGIKYLPSMQYFFFASDDKVIEYLETLHDK